MRFYPRVPTRRVGGRKGLRLAISDLVTVSAEPGSKRIPIDALPVAVRRVLHHEASGGRERVDMLSLQANDDSAGAYDARSLCRHCTNVLAFVPLLATLARLWVKTTHSREHVNVILC